MTLDLAAVSKLMSQMGTDMANAVRLEEERVAEAVAILRQRAADVDGLTRRLAAASFPSLAAGIIEPLDRRISQPAIPSDYIVAATDGSLVEPDRHGAAYYYLLNIGSVVLRYGHQPKADLQSIPRLGYRPEDMYLALGEREVPLEGGVLRVLRAVAELERLVAIVTEQTHDRPAVALQDGTLILWMPEGRGQEAELRRALLEPYLAALDRLRAAKIPVASYISRPRSGELVNTLRLAICPFDPVECREHCSDRATLKPSPCDRIGGVADRSVLGALPLADGERSALFASRSRVVVEQYREHKVRFFYMNVGSEVARVEAPAWVADDEASLALVQAIIYDQCRRGQGYPRALTEAHEKAVVGMAEREQCERLVEMVLAKQGLHLAPSQKQLSKRVRGV